jgi:hypothetical protein
MVEIQRGFFRRFSRRLLEEFKIHVGYIILDPFVGSLTISLMCKRESINSIGFDILPISKLLSAPKRKFINIVYLN